VEKYRQLCGYTAVSEIWTFPLKHNTISDGKRSYGLRNVKLARGHTFICSPVLRGSTVIDGGAHRCEFAGIMARNYGTRVIALEPNTALPVEHCHPDISLVRAALSAEDGEGSFFLNENPEGSSIFQDPAKDAEDPEAVSVKFRGLRSLVEEFDIDEIGLLKLDIEGAEFDVIRSIDDDFARMIHQISVEFHPADPMRGEEIGRMEGAFAHLAKHGFNMCRSSYRGYGDVLFLNSRYFENPTKMFRVLLPYYRKVMERPLYWSEFNKNNVHQN